MGPLGRLRSHYQVTIAAAAVAGVFFVRLTQLRGSSPYELFLLLNIAVAIFLRPAANLTSVLLGLLGANCVVVLELMGGQIIAESQGIGKGASFSVRLPVQREGGS